MIRRRQPYHYTRSQPRHYLAVLAALNNRDKHRTLQPIWVQPRALLVRETGSELPLGGLWRPSQPIARSDYVVSIYVIISPAADVGRAVAPTCDLPRACAMMVA